jgi:hypothetical protein
MSCRADHYFHGHRAIQQGVRVQLTADQGGLDRGSEALIVTIAKNGKIYLSDNAMSPAELGRNCGRLKIKATSRCIFRRIKMCAMVS